jgi:hypothetical protein
MFEDRVATALKKVPAPQLGDTVPAQLAWMAVEPDAIPVVAVD